MPSEELSPTVQVRVYDLWGPNSESPKFNIGYNGETFFCKNLQSKYNYFWHKGLFDIQIKTYIKEGLRVYGV